MFKVMAFISRRAGTSPEAFREYYETQHVPLVVEVAPPMAAYRRNYLNPDEAFKRNEDELPFDVVTEMLFETREDCQRWFDTFFDPEVFARVQEDELQFLDPDRVRLCVVEVESTDYQRQSNA
jgi:uncharacterized protein (TIGR02118 family)